MFQKIGDYDCPSFVSYCTDHGDEFRILSILDEYSRECLALDAARQFAAADPVAVMKRLMT